MTSSITDRRHASQELTTQALKATSPAEVDAILALAADPYAEDAINRVAGIPIETEGRRYCEVGASIAASTVNASDLGTGIGVPRPTLEAAYEKECESLDPGVYLSSPPSLRMRLSCANTSTIAEPSESPEAYAARREADQKRAEDECRKQEDDRLFKEQEAEAARRLEYDAKSAAFQSCRSSVRARLQSEVTAAQAQAREETEKQREEKKSEAYRSCMTEKAGDRLTALCNGTPSAGEASAWYATARNTKACADANAAKKTKSGETGSRLRNELGLLISAYASEPAESRLQDCRAEMGTRASVCEKLEAAARVPNAAIAAVYTNERMAAAQAHFTELLKTVDAWIASAPLSESDRAKLRARMNGVKLATPAGSAGLEQLTRGGGGFFICGYSEKTNSNDPCQSKQMQLSPEFLVAMASDDPDMQASVLPVIVHELGHGLAPIQASSAPPFGNLAACLNTQVSTGKFAGGNQKTVQGEAVADWIAGEIVAQQVAQASPSTLNGKAKSAENHLAPLLCGVFNHSLPTGCGPNGITSDPQKPGAFPNELDLLSESCRELAAEMDHPLGPDRANVFFSSATLKKALGCPAESSKNDTRTRSCSL